MSSFTIPQSVSQNIARAKSLLKRDEPLRAIEALITGMNLYDPSALLGKARFEAEVLIQECVNELNRQPQVRHLIETLSKSRTTNICYTPGSEGKIKAILPILRKGLLEMESAKENAAVTEKETRKKTLQEKGKNFLKSGEMAKGKATLRVLADEFGEEPGILAMLGEWMYEAGLYFEAAEFLEQAIDLNAKDSPCYGLAASCYITLREFEKAETIYLKAIKTFGKHSKTLTNLAKVYLDWGKKEKAFDAAQDAYKLDPKNKEAKAIFDKLA